VIVLPAGAAAISTIERYADDPGRPDFSEHVDGSLEDRKSGLQGMISRRHTDHGRTCAGDEAFSAGNDLTCAASGEPMWVPKNGFAVSAPTMRCGTA
jgi:hypothetical protein